MSAGGVSVMRPADRPNQTKPNIMNYITSYKSLLLAAACAFGAAAPAFASDDPAMVSSAPTTVATGSHGVLGHNLAELGFSYIDIDDSSVDASAMNLTLNQGIRTGLDTLFEYSYLRSENTGVGRVSQQQLNIGGRAYTNYNGMKPFVDGGIGWAWFKAPGNYRFDSFVVFASVGAEIQATTDLTITPSVRYSYMTRDSDDKWDFGVKANYWLTEKLALTGKISMDDDQTMEYGLGVNFRF